MRRLYRLRRRLSRTREDSEIYALNRGDADAVSAETAALIAAALEHSAETGGAFDVTIAPLVELWGITTDTPRVPSDAAIDAALERVGSDHLSVTGNAVTLDEGCAVDLDAIAKGYASDRVADIFAAHGVKRGVASLGGNVYVRGTRPDGTTWRVAVQDPQGEGYACTLHLTDAFAVTSGGYQRYFTAPDGTVYPHILDPHTGYPAASDLLSVTVICDNGARADAYSTALYVMGEAAAVDFWRQRGDFDMLLITADGRLLCTPSPAVTDVAEGYTAVTLAA